MKKKSKDRPPGAREFARHHVGEQRRSGVMGDEDDHLLKSLVGLQNRTDALDARLHGMAPPRAIVVAWEDIYAGHGELPPGANWELTVADHAAASIAGLGGGLLDLSKEISKGLTNESMHRRLDAIFKERVAKSGDGTVAIDNALGGPSHRMVGPTHDVFRLFSAVKLVQAGRFESAVRGVLKEANSYRADLPDYLKISDPTEALLLVLLHWGADFFSKMSLPIPGWSKLAESNNVEFVRALFTAYRGGANLRSALSQLISNLSGLALISVVLHVYRYIDRYISGTMEFSLSSLSLSSDVRFGMMSRNANLIALAVSAAHAGVSQNIFALNYAAFFKFCADGRSINKLADGRADELEARLDVILRELT